MEKWLLRFPNPDIAKTQSPFDENARTLTETTAETTTKITADINSKSIQLMKDAGIEEPALSEIALLIHATPEFIQWRIDQWQEKQKTGEYTTGWLIGSLRRKAKPPKQKSICPHCGKVMINEICYYASCEQANNA